MKYKQKNGYYYSKITAGNEFKLYRERRVSVGGVVETTCTSGARYCSAPDIQMNDRMPRTCSSPEAYYCSET